MEFKNRVILIVGGTSGMGLEVALSLAKKGASIIALGNNIETANSSSQLLGNDHMVLTGDATNEQTIYKCIQKAHERFGIIHGLFHVAGGSGRKFGDGPLENLSLEGWNKTLELNLTTVMLSNKAIIQYFLENNESGSIVNMSSVLGYAPAPGYFATHAYAAAKAGIIGFSKSIASFYALQNIRINVIAPGLIKTPMSQRAIENKDIISYIRTKQPLDGGRPGTPKDIIGAVCMLLSDSSKFITGQVLAIDGGWSLSDGQYET